MKRQIDHGHEANKTREQKNLNENQCNELRARRAEVSARPARIGNVNVRRLARPGPRDRR